MNKKLINNENEINNIFNKIYCRDNENKWRYYNKDIYQ